jgi:putative effector of murein hydrolase LrgA (UPF0299 family)
MLLGPEHLLKDDSNFFNVPALVAIPKMIAYSRLVLTSQIMAVPLLILRGRILTIICGRYILLQLFESGKCATVNLSEMSQLFVPSGVTKIEK